MIDPVGVPVFAAEALEFAAAITRYASATAAHAGAGATRKLYVRDLYCVARWCERQYGAPFWLRELDLALLNAYRIHASTRVGPSTFNRRRSALRAFVRWARAAGLIEHDPSANLRGADWDGAAQIKWRIHLGGRHG